MRPLAQSDSLVQLPAVEVSAVSLRNVASGVFAEEWSGKELEGRAGQSMAEFLQNQSGIYFKTYGAGSLATAAVRGASASQTAVLWNGFPVQSPMLGLLDWSLLPVVFSDEIKFQHGGNSAAWGSGAVGGAVLMGNKPDFDNRFQLKLSSNIGSFGLRNGQATAKFSNQQFASSTRIFFQKAENDFPFRPEPSLPQQHQTNAAQWQKGLLQELYWRPKNEFLIGWQTWLQRTYREIPPTTTQTKSVANQADEAIRTALNFKWSDTENILQAKAAIFRESIHYRDKLAGIDTPSHFWTWIGEVDWQRKLFSNFKLQVAGNQSFTKAFIKNYKTPAERNQSAVFTAFRYQKDQINAQLDGRIEMVDGRFVPFIPSFGIEKRFQNWLSIGAKLGRNYRLPTLNDLNWSPGGNPNLLAEQGWSSEVNSQISWSKNASSLRFTTAVFNRKIKNWILWRPAEGQPFWAASNIAEVWSRGLENRLHIETAHQNWRFQLEGGYDFIRSTNEVAVKIPKIEKGQQLIYVPVHQGLTGAGITYHGFEIHYKHYFTGSVLTEFGSLPAFQIGDANLSYQQKINEMPCTLSFSIGNCWGADYRVIERRPMPGRAYQLSLSIGFTKN